MLGPELELEKQLIMIEDNQSRVNRKHRQIAMPVHASTPQHTKQLLPTLLGAFTEVLAEINANTVVVSPAEAALSNACGCGKGESSGC